MGFSGYKISFGVNSGGNYGFVLKKLLIVYISFSLSIWFKNYIDIFITYH